MLNMKMAKPEDAEQLGELLLECWKEVNAELLDQKRIPEITLQQCVELFRNNGCRKVVIGYFNNRAIGFCRFGETNDSDVLKNSAEIYDIYITERYRMNGFGRKLLQQAVRELREDDYRQLYVWCHQDNYNARSFIEAVGLRYDGTLRETEGYPVKRLRYFENI